VPTDLSPKVSIILLNYNGAEDTIACLQSLQKISYSNYNIVIVDNASPDGSMDKIKDYLQSQLLDYTVYSSPDEAMQSPKPQLKFMLLQTGHNGGYGYGNNIGIKYALQHGADYVLILNNDTVVDPGFLKPMVQMCEDDESIGIVSGKIYFYDRPEVIWFNGGRFHPCTGKVEHVNFNEKNTGQNPPKENTFISGCMWLIPRKVFETVGLINEEYFMYVEDLEFCKRVLNAGYLLKFCEKSHIWHKDGAATKGEYSELSVFWRTKNMNSFIAKYTEPIWCKLLAFAMANLRISLRLARSKHFSLFRIYIKAIKESISNK